MKKSLFVPIVAILSAAAILLAASFALNNVAEKTAQKKHLELMQGRCDDESYIGVCQQNAEETE